jgi:hypothetical protein
MAAWDEDRSSAMTMTTRRRRLTIFTKGEKVREVPIPDSAFWTDLERHILDASAEPHHYLLPSPPRKIPVGSSLDEEHD